ncbi:MAG TPA: coenzyme F420-0:L-glutamate ligase [Bryocella sp.]|nr:coenzyme F420-0:L-glutamate ligase [Bryocella sp.]
MNRPRPTARAQATLPQRSNPSANSWQATGHRVCATPVPGIGEVRPGDSIADLVLDALAAAGLRLQDGDILIVKHKIVSKAENRRVSLATVNPRAAARKFAKATGADARVVELAMREARRIVRCKHVLITETQHGFVCANSGVDLSNVDGGKTAVLLPADPDASAARIHRRFRKRTGLYVPVIIADSFGRAWREGLTEVAIGVAGMKALVDYRGKRDVYGYTMHATEEAIADELACVAGLVCGKNAQVPACIIRGYTYPRGQGSARQLVRAAEKDLFR